MADISKEIRDFEEAEYGEEVRGSMVNLAQKVNQEVEKNTIAVENAAKNATNAAADARKAAGETRIATDIANNATDNANAAAANTEATRQDLVKRVAAGEFKGDKGEKGDRGVQGESGVTAPAAGMFSLYLDPETGNLYADYPTGQAPPTFEYDDDTGSLYYVTG